MTLFVLILSTLGLTWISCDGNDNGTGPDPEDDGIYDPPEISESDWTGDLNFARNQHTATLLQDGRVLVTGGFDGTNKLSSCELYNPETGQWSITANMGKIRCLHTATLLEDGRVWVTGGMDENSHSIPWFELFDPATETWSEINWDYLPEEESTRMTSQRYAHRATLLNDGRVLVTGGYYTPSSSYIQNFEIYDPATNICQIHQGPDILMRRKRYCHTSTLLENGTVLIAGGYNADDGYHGFCDIFQAPPDTCLFAAEMTPSTMWHTADLLDDGRVLVAGGKISVTSFTTACRIYDPVSDSWSSTGNMREVMAQHRTVKLPDGRIFATGNTSTETAMVYHPDTGTWELATDILVSRHLATLTIFPNGVILIAGGLDNPSEYLTSSELYVLP